MQIIYYSLVILIWMNSGNDIHWLIVILILQSWNLIRSEIMSKKEILINEFDSLVIVVSLTKVSGKYLTEFFSAWIWIYDRN